MKKHVRPVLWITAAAGILFGLLITLSLLAPVLVNFEPVKQKIVAEFSRTTGGVVETRKIDLLFLPRPSVVLWEGRLSIPEKISGTFSSLSIYPQVLPLLRGKVLISGLSLERPDFQMSLPEPGKMEGLTQFSLERIDKILSSVRTKVTSVVPGLLVSVKKGTLTLLMQDRPVLSISGIDARAGVPEKRLLAKIVCTSDMWEHASLTGWFELGGTRGEGSLQFTGLRPGLIAQRLFPGMEPRIEDAEVNLEAAFHQDGAKLFRAELRTDVPRATLRKGSEALPIEKATLNGTFRLQGNKAEASLARLGSVYPALAMSGNLTVAPASSLVSAELHSNDVDVESLRKTLLFLGGDIPVIRSIFEILVKGRITGLNLASHGRSIHDLKKAENLVLQGSIERGTIFLPEERLYLEDVDGAALISQGIIEGKDIEARLGTVSGTKGALRLDLKGAHAPFHLAVTINADMAKLPFYLKRLVKDEAFSRELDLMKDIRGSASGKLVLDRTGSVTSVSLDADARELHVLYQRLPYPLDVSGKFSYDGPASRIIVKGANGKMGRSSFSQLSGQLSLDKDPYLRVTSGAGAVVLDEIYPWLSSLESIKGLLQQVRSVKGAVMFHALRAEGPLSDPGSWQFRAAGNVRDVVVAAPRLAATVEVREGDFEAGPEQLSLSRFHIRSQDSSLTISGILNHYLQGIDRADLSLHGEIGEKSALRIADLVHLPHEFRTRSPFSLSGVQLAWEKRGRASLSGDLRVERGPEASIDAVYEHEELFIRRLAIKDAQSDASLSFHLRGKELDLGFDGSLTKATLDGLLENNEILTGWITGNLLAHIVLDQPFNSVARGALKGAGLCYPHGPDGPVQIGDFSVNAQGNLFAVDSNLLASGHSLRIAGKVDILPDRFVFDADLFTNGLELDQILAKMPNQEGGGSFWGMPLKGVLRIESDYVKYGRLTWHPVRATTIFNPGTVSIGIAEANLCGIETQGIVEISQQGMELYIMPKAKRKDVRETLVCLSDVRDVSGHFSFDGEVSGGGNAEALPRSLKGTLEFEAKNGRIDRYELLAKILQVVSPSGIFKIPDLRKKGFPYYTIEAKGTLKNGKITVRDAVMDAPATDFVFNGEIDLIDNKIDAMVLVVPFKAIDRIISFIPLVNYVMAKRLVALPVKITGDLDSPKVTALPPSELGAGLLGVMKRTFTLPFKLIQPLFPEEKKGRP